MELFIGFMINMDEFEEIREEIIGVLSNMTESMDTYLGKENMPMWFGAVLYILKLLKVFLMQPPSDMKLYLLSIVGRNLLEKTTAELDAELAVTSDEYLDWLNKSGD